MIGDVLVSTVICQAIKLVWPESIVHYMIHPGTVAVVEQNPFIDKIIVFDPKTVKGFSALRRFGKDLKTEKYDAVIDAYGKWESVIPMFYSGADVRIGHHKWYTAPFYTKTTVPEKVASGSALRHRLQLAEALTGQTSEIAFPKIYLTEAEKASAVKLMGSLPNKPVVMVSVLGSSPDKSLPAPAMAQMLDVAAAAADITLLFNFMPNQQHEAQEIFDRCRPETQQKIVFDFYMKGLRPFLAVLSYCDALIGNEGGAVNMAKALGIPTFTVYSPWINKISWNMLDDDKTHVAVHLKDFRPELYGDSHPKKFKPMAMQWYGHLKPELFASQLEKYLKVLIS